MSPAPGGQSSRGPRRDQRRFRGRPNERRGQRPGSREPRGEFAGKALIDIPTFNEAENLPRLLPRIFQQNKAFHVLIVDDNSPDGTAQIVYRFDHQVGSEEHVRIEDGQLHIEGLSSISLLD